MSRSETKPDLNLCRETTEQRRKSRDEGGRAEEKRLTVGAENNRSTSGEQEVFVELQGEPSESQRRRRTAGVRRWCLLKQNRAPTSLDYRTWRRDSGDWRVRRRDLFLPSEGCKDEKKCWTLQWTDEVWDISCGKDYTGPDVTSGSVWIEASTSTNSCLTLLFLFTSLPTFISPLVLHAPFTFYTFSLLHHWQEFRGGLQVSRCWWQVAAAERQR